MQRAVTTAALLMPILGIVLPPGPSPAQGLITGQGSPMTCGKRAEIVRQLGEKYGETRRSVGLSGGQTVVEVYASDSTGSWTILITSPQGTSCLIAAGEAFEPVPASLAGKPT